MKAGIKELPPAQNPSTFKKNIWLPVGGVISTNVTCSFHPPHPYHLKWKDVINLDKQEVGSRMRKKRKEKNLTQVELSKACGISINYYSSIENGRNSPSLDVLNSIAKNLGVSLVYLLNDRIDEMEHRVAAEENRIKILFKTIPEPQRKLSDGLITQAARLRILLDDNWKDILENGEYEKFSQSENQIPYDRKRPIVENYDNRDRTYQSIMKQLTELLPQETKSKKSKLLGR